MDDWWGTLGGWFDDASDWVGNLFNSSGNDGQSVIDQAAGALRPEGSGGMDSGDYNLDGTNYYGDTGSGGLDSVDSPTLPTGLGNNGGGSGPSLLDQLGTTGSKVLDSVLGGNSRSTGLIASLATGALQGYQNNRNTNKQIAANAAQSEEAYQRLLKMRAVPAVGAHGSAVDFGVKFKGANDGLG